eukprot:6141511-Prymnesium_polylepis.1
MPAEHAMKNRHESTSAVELPAMAQCAHAVRHAPGRSLGIPNSYYTCTVMIGGRWPMLSPKA